MNILCIDIGTYSIKFITGKVEKKSFVVFDFYEEIIDYSNLKQSEEFKFIELIQNESFRIILNYIEENNFSGKIIFQTDRSYVTTRILDLPVSQRKKAELMIPFQLDENLPFSINDAHIVSRITKKNKGHNSLVNVSNKKDFKDLYENLKQNYLLPNILTTEVSIIDSFASWLTDKKSINRPAIQNNFAIIDIGHSTTKAYFIWNGELVSNHLGYCAGKDIDETISAAYDIPVFEASEFKHTNSYFLTEQQYDDVNSDQVEFAKVMKEAISPLIHDIRRWELGHRVKYGLPVDMIYITGGTSNIKNIGNFLTTELKIPILPLEINNCLNSKLLRIPDEFKYNFGLSEIMCLSQLSKNSPSNLLSGDFAGEAKENIPLTSTSFIASRALILSFVLIFFLTIEKALLKRDIKFLNAQISSLVKNPKFEFTSREKRKYKKNPLQSMKKIKKKNRLITQQINTLSSATKINAISPLVKLNEVMTNNPNIDLVDFKSDDNSATALFKSKDKNELNKLKDHISLSGLENAKASFKNKFTELEVYYELSK